MNSKKRELIDTFNKAVEDNYGFVFVTVYIKDTPTEEIIINPIENATMKTNYYANAYDDNLKLKVNPDIEITNFGAFNNLEELDYVKK